MNLMQIIDIYILIKNWCMLDNCEVVLINFFVSAAGMCCFEKSLGCLNGDVDEDVAQRLVETNIEIFKVCPYFIYFF